jgi:uncharacterized protein (DUF1015 family)
MTTIAHSIPAGWVSTGGTGAPNYDEFVSEREITELISAHPDSVLGVEMPHCTPESVAAGTSFSQALPRAVAGWERLRSTGHFRAFTEGVALYEIRGSAGVARGVFCLVETAEISSDVSHPGRVIRNEDVFGRKVIERTALIEALGALLSPVLLIQSERAAEFDAFVEKLLAGAGAPDIEDLDEQGQRHAVWLVGPGPDQELLLALAGAGELVVADGNHRSLAAQKAGIPSLLAVVTSPQALTIAPYHRLIRRLPHQWSEILAALARAGCEVRSLDGSPIVPPQGSVVLYLEGATYVVTLPPAVGSTADRLDHAVVERLLLRDVLGLDPGSPDVVYVGGDYPISWLVDQVQTGQAEMAVFIAPVPVGAFLDVNMAREKMPRKSTWFTPKARTGLIAADVSGGLCAP